MKNNIEFQTIGKEIPYKTPLGFFDKISEETLQKAKRREEKRRKTRRLWRTVSVAASLAALFFLGYFMLEPGIKSESNRIVQELLPAGKQIVQQNREIATNPTVTEIKQPAPEKAIVYATETEVISDVLADLTDDELSQMAARFQTDPFLSESAQ